MSAHPIRDPKVQADVELKSKIVESFSWGELNIKFKLKDGRWTVANVTVTFPRMDE